MRSPTPLLTSDQPVLLLQRQAPTSHGIGLGTADRIVYPLDRHRVLIMCQPEPGLREGVVDGTAHAAHALNIALAKHARRWIFHHPTDNPLEGVPFTPNPRTQEQ